jgi:Domain of unknown function (DUF3854)
MRQQLTKRQLTSLMEQDLERSGLTVSDGYFLPGEYQERQGYFIYYPTLDGLKSDFFRFRFLDTPTGFAALIKKPQRYVQPSNLPPRAYFSTLYKWPKILADPSQRLLITEGEKKAAAACKHGLPCIGLGGVWNFRAKGSDTLIPDLLQIEWSRRQVVIVLDSDAAINRQLQKGAAALTSMLSAAGGTA